jgi:mannose-6-phosphate isomerase-like protein (cupin superfamily)
MTSQDFPSFVQALPEAEMSAPGHRGWLLQGDAGQVLYHEADTEVEQPEHAHGEQWGVVLRGRIEVTIEGRIRVFTRGDVYHIPSGARHRVHLFPGFRAVDHLGGRDGYRVKNRH